MSSFLITGAGRGLGFGLVERLASQPASEVKLVIASARKTSDNLTKLAAANPGRVFIVTLEVTDVPSVQKAAEQVRAILKEHNATLDVLFNNAGILNRLPNSVLAMTDLEETFHVNVVGLNIVTKEFLPLLREGKGKKIVNMSSVIASLATAAKLASLGTPAYKISKAAVNMLTTQWANEFGKEGFSIFAVSPGSVKTDMGGEESEITIDQSVTGLLRVIKESDSTSNGKFFDIEVEGWEPTWLSSYKGGEMEW